LMMMKYSNLNTQQFKINLSKLKTLLNLLIELPT